MYKRSISDISVWNMTLPQIIAGETITEVSTLLNGKIYWSYVCEFPSELVGNPICKSKMLNKLETLHMTLTCNIFSHFLFPCRAISKVSLYYPSVRLCTLISTLTTPPFLLLPLLQTDSNVFNACRV